MKKKTVLALTFLITSFFVKAQNLETFFTEMQPNEGNNYLSITNKKALTIAQGKVNKNEIDFALIATNNNNKQTLEWYNMSGNDGKIPPELKGTSTMINAISFDKDQFDKCISNQDFKRMTGHITNNSFSHFASITDDIEKGIIYHCFIIQLENGKRGLMWLENTGNNSFKVIVKVQK